ncbi:hypothetical protein VSDG_00924 [Cytospora chrysosperma]|uniref:Major facilitator superfamily (MFS) profile domain-containing protein n=1 Tax=Cytospora chrysosperma TaxID=252740 RepID=A0A423WLB4_CYTCH|nr:hypothetical protein VSDG_00924 [Valsa sordida]
MISKSFWAERSLRTSDKKRTKAAELTLKESLYPICLVTIVFFLWGFSYGLLDTLNKHFQNTLGISKARSSGLQAAYFGAYPLASLGHAAWILRHYSYRAVFIWGLCLYGIGALLCIPAILHRSFAGFCVCIFIIGNGLGSLETAANPYITICGPPKYSEIRINISQAFNGIGTVIAPVLGSYVFFNFGDEKALENVQWVYLAIACFVYFINYVTETRADTSSALGSQFLAGAQGAFALGRFVGVGLMHWAKPRIVFGIFLTMCIVFVGPSITQHGNTGMSMLYITLFFESICFPTIVALGMRGLGRHTKRGSGFIVAGVMGGACVPPLTGAVADLHSTSLAMVVPMAFFVAAWSYALAVNFWPSYRDTADAFTETDIGLRGHSEVVAEGGALGDDEEKVAAMEQKEIQS